VKEIEAMTKHMTGTRIEWLAARLELLEVAMHFPRRQFSTEEAIDMDAGWENTLDAVEVFVAQQPLW
jgi:hypothetical protein